MPGLCNTRRVSTPEDPARPAASDMPEAGRPFDTPPVDDALRAGITRLALLAVVGGAITGLLGGTFRIVLVELARSWNELLHWTRDSVGWRWLLPVVLAALAAGIARLLVRWAPEASGSGVQRVEANMRAEVPPAPLKVIPAKYVGGALAIGAGMALGREGPTVQMGASVGGGLARYAKLGRHDTRTLAAALAGTGLGVAFSAPLGGALFVFEEVARAFRTKLVVTTFVGSAVALAVAQWLVGHQPIFLVGVVRPVPAWQLVVFALLGAIFGALGVGYNWLVLAMLRAFDQVSHVAPEVKAAAVGACIGLLGVVAPHLIGGGDGLNERVLIESIPIGSLLIIFAVRWVLGPFSYSAGTPGGLFAPLLLVGASAGALIASVTNSLLPSAQLSVTAFAIVGMSTFFAATVRAPFTGVVLIIEMTATTAVVVPMVLAAGVAVLVASKLKGPPIYETLRLRMEKAPT